MSGVEMRVEVGGGGRGAQTNIGPIYMTYMYLRYCKKKWGGGICPFPPFPLLTPVN